VRVLLRLLPLLLMAAPALAQDVQPYWQCAAFARQFSGIPIRGDAWTWWGQAEGRFERGSRPRVGAVMAFVPGEAAMRLGHVATVTGIRGPRELTITHANWSPIDGRRGHIERDVLVRDVSENNDWSRVRVWYAPLGDLGTTAWAIDGFIYPGAAAPTVAPRLDYASFEARSPKRSLLGADVIRMAALESRLRP
jgi:surface antigen